MIAFPIPIPHLTTLPPINVSANRPLDERWQQNPHGGTPITNPVPETVFPILPCNVHSPESSQPEIDNSLATDLGTLVNMADQLRRSLPADCLWLGRKDLKVIGTHPVDAGGFADVWAGEMTNRKIVIKSYRCHASTDDAQTYSASSA